jgi:TRAP-type C4-dicarboxylate transport system substrate-binding protein
LKAAMQKAIDEAVAFQRDLHVREEDDAQKAIDAEGGQTVTLTAQEHDAFVAAVQPMLRDARGTFGDELFKLI